MTCENTNTVSSWEIGGGTVGCTAFHFEERTESGDFVKSWTEDHDNETGEVVSVYMQSEA